MFYSLQNSNVLENKIVIPIFFYYFGFIFKITTF